MIDPTQNPTEYDVVAALMLAGGRYIEFQYNPLPECRQPKTASRIAADADTVVVAPPDVLRGHLDLATGGVRMTKAGNFIVTLRNINRRKRMPTGDGYYRDKRNKTGRTTSKTGFVKGEYLYRSFRLDVRNDGYGIDLVTLRAANGKKGKVMLFPNVETVPNVPVWPPVIRPWVP